MASGWRYAGHLARLADRGPARWISALIAWRDAAYRRTARRLLWRQSDPARQRLDRGNRSSTAGRWGDQILRPHAMPKPRDFPPAKRQHNTTANWGGWSRYTRRHRTEEPCRGRFVIGNAVMPSLSFDLLYSHAMQRCVSVYNMTFFVHTLSACAGNISKDCGGGAAVCRHGR